MANLTESSVYESGVPQLETTTPAIGGPGGVMNAQSQALANRTAYLKAIATAQQAEIDLKVDKVTGKGLSTNDFDDAAKTKLAGIEALADVTDEAHVTAVANATAEVTAAPDHIWGLAGGALKRWTKAGFESVVKALLPSAIEGGTATTTPADTDVVPGVKADHSRLYYTWANIKAAIATAFSFSTTLPTANGKTAADEIGVATGATTALKLANLASPASTTQQGVALLGASDGAAKLTKMPDGATAVYSQDVWATIDGWATSAAEGTLSVVGGVLRYVRGATNNIYVRKSLGFPGMSSKTIVFRFRASKACTLTFGGYSSTTPLKALSAKTEWQVDSVLCPVVLSGNNERYPSFWMGADSASGDWFEIDWIWIGDYSYLTGSLSEEAARIADQLGDTPGVGAAATATITATDVATATKGDTIHGKKYTFVAALTAPPGVEGEVLKGANKEEDLANESLAISEAARTNNGTKYWAATVHPTVSSAVVGAVMTLTAKTAGILGNQITVVCESGTNHTPLNPAGGTTTLAGGVDDAGAKIKATLGPALGAGANVGAMPTRTATSIIGYRGVADCASGAQVTLPAGGTWLWRVGTYGATYNGLKAGTAAGGLMSGTASANLTMFYERIA